MKQDELGWNRAIQGELGTESHGKGMSKAVEGLILPEMQGNSRNPFGTHQNPREPTRNHLEAR